MVNTSSNQPLALRYSGLGPEPVPLNGRGMVIHPNGGFLPGEFRKLLNCELIDEKIISRRPIHSILTGSMTPTTLKFKGVLGNTLIYNDELSAGQKAITPVLDGVPGVPRMSSIDLFDMSQINGLSAAQGSQPALCFVFNYNNRNYWLVNQSLFDTVGMSSDSIAAVASNNFYLLKASEDAGIAAVVDPRVVGYNAELAGKKSIIRFNYASSVDPGKVLFRNAFMFKDRLWVTLDSGIYFSKATDPETFSVPNGGFFTFPNDNVNYTVALRDTIYVFCDTKIYSITYSTDPNTDATIRVLTDKLGGTHGVVYQDTVFFLSDLGIFSIVNNTYVSKLIDSEEFGLTGSKGHTLEAFGDYIVLNKGVQDVIDLTPYTTRYNKFRAGYVTNATVPSNILSAGAFTTVALDNAAGAVTGLGLASTSAIKVVNDAAHNIMGIVTNTGVAGNRMIQVNSGETYLFGAWVKNNVAAGGAYFITVRVYDSAGVLLDQTSYPVTVSASGVWQQITAVHTIGNNQANGIPDYVQILVDFQKGGLVNFTAGEGYWITLFSFEPYRGATPYLFASNNDTAAKLYNVNPNTIGPQRLYYNPISGVGCRGQFANKYDASLDDVGLGVQTYFINMITKAVHGLTPVNQGASQPWVRTLDMVTIQYTSVAYSGPLIMFSNTDLGVSTTAWEPNFMLMDKNRTTKLFGYRDTLYNLIGGSAEFSYRPNVAIELESFVPDGHEFLMKKFRSIMIMGRLPSNTKFQYSLDDKAYSAQIAIDDTRVTATGPPVVSARPPFPKRIGLNGRGHSISFFIGVSPLLLTGSVPWEFDFEITAMQVVWGYTGRGIEVMRAT